MHKKRKKASKKLLKKRALGAVRGTQGMSRRVEAKNFKLAKKMKIF